MEITTRMGNRIKQSNGDYKQDWESELNKAMEITNKTGNQI